MRLRNKKTGEVIDLDIANIKAQFGGISVIPEPVRLGGDEYVYHSLAELNEEWEDYKPAEPLIQDEKIRKAVRAWATENIIKKVKFEYIAGTGSIFKDEIGGVEIDFYGDLKLTNRETYTIAELCGEEEECSD